MATSQPRSASNSASSPPTRRPPVISTTLPWRDRRLSVAGVAISDALPEDVGDAGAAIHGAGQHEQEIAEPIQVDDRSLGDVLARAAATGVTASRSARRQTVRARWSCAAADGAPGQDELGQWLQLVLQPVDRGFQASDVLLRDGIVEWPVGDGSASAEPTTNNSSWSWATRRSARRRARGPAPRRARRSARRPCRRPRRACHPWAPDRCPAGPSIRRRPSSYRSARSVHSSRVAGPLASVDLSPYTRRVPS